MSNLSNYLSRLSIGIAGNTTGTLQTIGNGTFVLAGGPNVTLSQSGRTVTVSANAGGGGANFTISAGTSSLSSGTISFADSNGVSWGLSNGTLTATVKTNYAGTGVTTAGTNVSLSGTLNSNGLSIQASAADPALKAGTGFTSAGNNIGLSGTLNTAGLSLSATVAAQTVESQSIGMSNVGNTSGTTGVASGGQIRYVLAGGNNVTLSQSLNGASGTVTISAFNQTAESNTFGISNLGNTSGTSGTIASNQARLLFAGGNNITLSQSTNGGSATITISGPNTVAQTNQTLGIYGSSQTTGQSSSSTYDARSLSVVGAGQVSVGWSNSSLIISATTAAQTNQTAGIYASSNTTGQSSSSTHDARSLSIVGAGIASVGWSNSSLLISVPSGGGAGDGGVFAGVSTGGNTAGSTGTVSTGNFVLVGSNNITLSQSTAAAGSHATVTILGPNIPAQSNQTLGIYGSSQTTGQSSSSTYDARSLSIVGAGQVSVGWSNSSLIISATTAVQTVESQSIGASNLGNTLGTSGVASGGQVRAVIIGTSNITVSQSVNGASATLSLIADPPFVAGVSNLGSTAGATGATSTRVVLVGSGGNLLSQTTDAAGATITIDGQASTYSQFAGMQPSGVGIISSNSFLLVQPISVFNYVTATRVELYLSMTVSTSSNSSHAGAISIHHGVYTLTGSTLSLASSASMSAQWSNTSNNSTLTLVGPRRLTQTMNVNMTPGEYYFAHIFRTASTNANWFTISYEGSVPILPAVGDFGQTLDTRVMHPIGLGRLSTTTNALPSSIALSNLRSDSVHRMANFGYFNSTT